MSLQPCPECGQEVSDDARSCPGCGVKFRQSNPVVKYLAIVLLLFVVVSVAIGLWQSQQDKNELEDAVCRAEQSLGQDCD